MRAWLDGLWQDVRDTWRLVCGQPGFTAVAIVTLAIGIGATTAIFSVVNGVLLRPLAYPDSDALVRIVHSIGGIEQEYFNDAIYTAYTDNTQALQDVGVWIPGETATVTSRGDPEELRVLRASRGVLTTLGVRPEAGRWFLPADDEPGAPDVAMLGYGYWLRRFGSDRNVVGQSLMANARPYLIVGVMPAGFRFAGEPDLFLPLRIDRGNLISGFRLLGVARLKPGVTLDAANADAARVLQVWFEDSRVRPDVRARWAPALRTLKQDVVGDVGRTLWILMGAIGVVLLMACGNVANLLLVRAAARQQEFAVRVALGASAARMVRLFLLESVTLALAGGALGVGLAWGGLQVLHAIGPSNLPRLDEIALDAMTLGFALTLALASGVIFGIVAAVGPSQPRIVDALSGSSRLAGSPPARQRSQQALVAAQVALALLLLVGSGLMIRSFQALHRVEPGFVEPRNVLTFGISVSESAVAEPERVTRLQQAVLDRVREIPGVTSTAFTTRLPMGRDRSSAALAIEDRADDGRTPPNRQVKILSPGMFRTLGTPLAAGRDFTWTDVYELRDVAIVSENLARELWGSPEAALGRRVREYYVRASRWREIVGVARDVHDDGADQAAPETIYWPAQPLDELLSLSEGYQSRRVSVAMRIEPGVRGNLLEQVQAAVWSIDPDLPLAEVRTLDEVYGQSMARTSFTLVMLAVAGSMALLLGLSGLFGVMAYAVARRRREIGVRMALGARARDIRRLFLRRALALVVVGIAMGLAGVIALAGVMQSLLFGIGPLDPITLAGMPLLLAAAAALASDLPARRAAAVDPVEVLRAG